MMCPYCKKENKNTNIRCEFCGTQLINDVIINQNNTITYNENKNVQIPTKKIGCIVIIIFLLMSLPSLFLGTLSFGLDAYLYIKERIQSVGYEETIGNLINYDDCEFYDDNSELCNAVYEYKIGEVTYSISPNLLSSRSGFSKTMTVHYNPDNPKEAVIYIQQGISLFGIVFIICSLIPIITIIIVFKKISKNKSFKTYN